VSGSLSVRMVVAVGPLSVRMAVAVAVVLALLALLLLAAVSVAADPSATPAGVLEGGDLRSEGEGPGLVGNPLLILGAVVALGLATVAVTLLIARLTQRHQPRS
jgi:hypothetical protein